MLDLRPTMRNSTRKTTDAKGQTASALEQYLNKITQGDCLPLLRSLPDNCVDITFADPPFNLRKKYNSAKDNLAVQDYLNWCEEWIAEMVRVTRPTGSIFLHNIPKWLTYYAAILNRLVPESLRAIDHTPVVLKGVPHISYKPAKNGKNKNGSTLTLFENNAAAE